MNLDLTGKVALVTGSTQGIGYHVAEGLARLGARVHVNGRGQPKIDAAMQHITHAVPGATVTGVAADVGTEAGCRTLTETIPAVDILVNNAGIFEPKPFLEIPDAEWTRFFEVNVMSGVRLSRAYLPGMLANNWGRIVFVSSESGVFIPAEMIHYGMTKTAQLAVSRGIAETTKGTAVTVNAVLPGPTLSEGVTEFMDKMGIEGATPEEKGKGLVQAARPTSLLQRPTTPEEVANMILYVCSPAASATNGAALRVDGGVVRSVV